MPIRRARSACCPRAASGHAAAAPPRSVMNSRLLNSITLLGAAEQREREREAERLGGLEVQEQLNFRGLLNRQVAEASHP